jgi:hypothetical protein
MNDEERRFVIDVLERRERDGATVEERVARQEDHRHIREVLFKYGYYSDLQHWTGLFGIYTNDVRRSLSGTVHETTEGLDGLRSLVERRTSGTGAAATGSVGPDVRRRHHIDTEVVKVSDDGAQAWAVALGSVVVTREQGDYAIAAHEDVYLFTLRKVDGTWLISEQVAVTDNARNPVLHPPT